ncbi:MAG: T9SS type A sorting domain-containing protein [Candidatus Latescibacteria bacterium]|nr:T9SS type A sorting domain-containing protein [Candidatus Latescibacterota bacterium]
MDDNVVALDSPAWQEVDIPLVTLGIRPEDSVENIRFPVNMQGSVRLADIRLVAALLPAATAVVERRPQVQSAAYELYPNYPNPFNNSTVIRFALPQRQAVSLIVYNLAGQQVATLVDGMRATGTYAVQWDGRDDQQRALASGLYFYRLQAGDQLETRKLMLIR